MEEKSFRSVREGQEILIQLESGEAEIRKAAMQALLDWLGLSVGEFALRLGISKQTGYAWLSGGFAPRQDSIRKIRDIWLRPAPDRPVVVEDLESRRRVGIWSKRHFLHRTALSKMVLIFKDYLELHAGKSPAFRQDVVNAIATTNTKIFYIFIDKESPARKSLAEFSETVQERPEVGKRMFVVDAFAWKDTNKLGSIKYGQEASPASPFLFEYSDPGKSEFGKAWDVMFELPCQRYDVDGRRESDNDEEHIWVEIPHPRAESMRNFLLESAVETVSFMDWHPEEQQSNRRPPVLELVDTAGKETKTRRRPRP